ncbi:biotin--[acetyl-CoA-carboxylase] ligase [Persicobacter diffluens]
MAKKIRIGKEIKFLPTCQSTNSLLMQMTLQDGTQNGSVIVTEDQTAGRGQRGNGWESEPGANLTFSIALKPEIIHLSEQFYLSMVIALGIYKVLKQYIPQDELQLKWPNDILVGKKKICGILIENVIKQGRMEWSVIGIGLNVNQIEFELGRAISLAMICGQPFDKQEILRLILQSIEQEYTNLAMGRQQALKTDYLNALYGYEQVCSYKDLNGKVIEGEIVDVEDQGPLVLKVNGKLQRYQFKEIKFLSLEE